MNDDMIQVKLIEGQAEVSMRNRRLNVSRRDLPEDPYNCPVELVVGALGS